MCVFCVQKTHRKIAAKWDVATIFDVFSMDEYETTKTMFTCEENCNVDSSSSSLSAAKCK